ncbi:agmatinase [Clostridia bacterium]|nr:agmatinase [Clostridia bacterium]
METQSRRIIGCDMPYKDADIVVFGAPFDGTCSNKPGTRFAGQAVRDESFGIETYSPYLDRDLEDLRIADIGELDLPFGNTARVMKSIYGCVKKIVSAGKKPVMIGGEHLVTLPAVKAMHEAYPNLRLVHFDAHADLRDEYLGESLSHACVIRRCYEILGKDRIFQFGIRSGTRDEFLWAETHTRLTKFTLDGIARIRALVGDNPVYLTVDLDVLDTSVFPATGTPEAGGIMWGELLQGMRDVGQTAIVGADLCEYSPPYDTGRVCAALTAKTLRELLLLL